MNKRYRMNPLLFAMSAAGLCTLSTLTAAYGANSAPAIDVSQVHSSGAQSTSVGEGRGRDSSYPLPPAQIRTSGITAYGSYLRS